MTLIDDDERAGLIGLLFSRRQGNKRHHFLVLVANVLLSVAVCVV
jgi:hypothetical protein